MPSYKSLLWVAHFSDFFYIFKHSINGYFILFLMMPISDIFDGINLLIVSALTHGRLLPHVFHCEIMFDLFQCRKS